MPVQRLDVAASEPSGGCSRRRPAASARGPRRSAARRPGERRRRSAARSRRRRRASAAPAVPRRPRRTGAHRPARVRRPGIRLTGSRWTRCGWPGAPGPRAVSSGSRRMRQIATPVQIAAISGEQDQQRPGRRRRRRSSRSGPETLPPARRGRGRVVAAAALARAAAVAAAIRAPSSPLPPPLPPVVASRRGVLEPEPCRRPRCRSRRRRRRLGVVAARGDALFRVVGAGDLAELVLVLGAAWAPARARERARPIASSAASRQPIARAVLDFLPCVIGRRPFPFLEIGPAAGYTLGPIDSSHATTQDRTPDHSRSCGACVAWRWPRADFHPTAVAADGADRLGRGRCSGSPTGAFPRSEPPPAGDRGRASA